MLQYHHREAERPARFLGADRRNCDEGRNVIATKGTR